MIFPSLRSPPRRKQQNTDLRRLSWFPRIFKTPRSDQTVEPSYQKNQGDLTGSEGEPLAGSALQ